MIRKTRLILREEYSSFESLLELARNHEYTEFWICQPEEHAPFHCLTGLSHEDVLKEYNHLADLMEANNNELNWMFGSTHWDPDMSQKIADCGGGFSGDISNIAAINASKINVHHYSARFASYTVNYNMPEDNNISKSILFSSLMRGAWEHRCMLIDKFFKYNLLDKGIVTWQYLADEVNFNWKHWTPERLILDMKVNQTDTSMNIFTNVKDESPINISVYPKEIDNVLLDVVVESSLVSSFITEKTFKALFNGMPFVVFGRVNQNAILRDRMGFKLYDNIISYDFDSVFDLETRAEMLCQELLKLEDQDYNQLWEQTRDIARFNINRFFDILLNLDLMPDRFAEIARGDIDFDFVGKHTGYENYTASAYPQYAEELKNLRQKSIDKTYQPLQQLGKQIMLPQEITTNGYYFVHPFRNNPNAGALIQIVRCFGVDFQARICATDDIIDVFFSDLWHKQLDR